MKYILLTLLYSFILNVYFVFVYFVLFLDYVRNRETQQCTYCGLQILCDGGKREDRWFVICQCPGFVP